MSDYKFFMANVVVIIALAFGFAFYGLADILDEDVDIGEGGEDFDTNDLILEPDTDFIQQERNTMLVWDGDDEVDPYGIVSYTFDTNDPPNTTSIAVEVDSTRFAGNSEVELWVVYEDPENPDAIIQEFDRSLTTGETVITDLDTEYDNPVTQVEIRLYDNEGEQGLVNIESVDTDAIENREDWFFNLRTNEVPRDIDEGGFFSQATDTLTTTFNSIAQVPSVIGAWVSFMFAIPGTIGTAFRIYITGFFLYFVIDYIWIG